MKPHPHVVYQALRLRRDEHPPIAISEIPQQKLQCERNVTLNPLPTPECDHCLYWEIKRPLLNNLLRTTKNEEQTTMVKVRCIKEIQKVLSPKQDKDFNFEEKKLSSSGLKTRQTSELYSFTQI